MGRKTLDTLTPHPGPLNPNPTPYTLHPTPYTLHPTPYTLHPTPNTLNPAPYTLNPKPYTLRPKPLTQPLIISTAGLEPGQDHHFGRHDAVGRRTQLHGSSRLGFIGFRV